MTFNQRVALVTGAGRGIGKAIAGQLAQGGVTVICASKNGANCGAVAAALQAAGGKARALPIDVTDGAAIARASAELLAEFGTIDILVNNAGITRDGLLFRMSEEDWNAVLATNLTSCFHWTKLLGRAMTQKRWGRIVNIASVVGLTGNAGQANYAAAKAGLIGFSKSIAKEFARRNVTVQRGGAGLHQDRHDGRAERGGHQGRFAVHSPAAPGRTRRRGRIWPLFCAPRKRVISRDKFLPLTAAW